MDLPFQKVAENNETQDIVECVGERQVKAIEQWVVEGGGALDGSKQTKSDDQMHSVRH